jgi:putative transposase
MSESNRLIDSTEWIDLDLVKRERTPHEIIETGIQLHLAGLSLSNTK